MAAAPAAFAYVSPCANNTACLYATTNYQNHIVGQYGGYGLMNIVISRNDSMSSWANKTSRNAAWYEDTNGGGFCRNMPRYSELNVAWADNDKASSWRTDRGC